MYINGNELSFHRLVPNRNVLRARSLRNAKPVNGFDTETYKGYARLITDSKDAYAYVSSIEEVLRFMTRYQYRSCHNFFYNLKFDYGALFKYLPDKEFIELYKEGELEFGEYKIKYIPGKILTIRKGRYTFSYYDIAQYYKMKLMDAAEVFLGEKKNEEDVDAARLNVDEGYWDEREKDILSYCKHDSWLTEKLGVLLQETYVKAFGYAPQRYLSIANISKDYFARECNVPDIRKIDRKNKMFAFHCYHGGRFELLKKGHFDWVTSLDIVSAYPYYIANLTQCTEGEWYDVKEADYDALHGYYMCEVDVPEHILPPFIVNVKGGVKLFPFGHFITHLTLQEVQYYSEICNVKVRIGVEFKSKDRSKPFKEAIEKLVELKQVSEKTDFRRNVYKTTMNSYYGSFYEKYENGETVQEAKTFNPFYASEITANTRMQVYKEAVKYGDRAIGFATDAVIVEGKVDAPEKGPLGSFTKDVEGEAVMLQTGINLIGDRVKSRGMQKSAALSHEGVEYDDIFDYMRRVPDQTLYRYDNEKAITPGEAIAHHRKRKISDINTWQMSARSLDINKEMKRMWLDKFKGGGEMFERHIESRPKDIRIFEAEQKASKL